MVSSCVTKRQNNSWHEYPSAPFFFNLKMGSVSVIIDHVREENIAQQVYSIAETFIESRQKNYNRIDKTLLLNISVEQRSFMHNVDMYNSIFISVNALDEEGNIYTRKNEFISGKKTFIAASEQNIIITRILRRVLREQRKYNNNSQKYESSLEKEIQRQERNTDG